MDAVRKRSCLGQRAGTSPERTLIGNRAVSRYEERLLGDGMHNPRLGFEDVDCQLQPIGLVRKVPDHRLAHQEPACSGGHAMVDRIVDQWKKVPVGHGTNPVDLTGDPFLRLCLVRMRHWWLPGHSHACVYEMKDGTKVVRPVSAGY